MVIRVLFINIKKVTTHHTHHVLRNWVLTH
jgi:hypothetical protein